MTHEELTDFEKLKKFLSNAVSKQEISMEMWQQFLMISSNRDYAKKALNYEAIKLFGQQARSENPKERTYADYCDKNEWETPSGELYHVMFLVEMRVITESWWRKKIAEEQAIKNG